MSSALCHWFVDGVQIYVAYCIEDACAYCIVVGQLSVILQEKQQHILRRPAVLNAALSTKAMACIAVFFHRRLHFFHAFANLMPATRKA